jgi:hypothetical protein
MLIWFAFLRHQQDTKKGIMSIHTNVIMDDVVDDDDGIPT